MERDGRLIPATERSCGDRDSSRRGRPCFHVRVLLLNVPHPRSEAAPLTTISAPRTALHRRAADRRRHEVLRLLDATWKRPVHHVLRGSDRRGDGRLEAGRRPLATSGSTSAHPAGREVSRAVRRLLPSGRHRYGGVFRPTTARDPAARAADRRRAREGNGPARSGVRPESSSGRSVEGLFTSFCAERDHRIDFRGATRGQVEARAPTAASNHGHERSPIAARTLNNIPPSTFVKASVPATPEQRPAQHQLHPVPDDQFQHAAQSAEGYAQAELARAARRDTTSHRRVRPLRASAVPGKDREQRHRESLPADRARHAPPTTRNRRGKLRVQRGHPLPDGGNSIVALRPPAGGEEHRAHGLLQDGTQICSRGFAESSCRCLMSANTATSLSRLPAQGASERAHRARSAGPASH